MTRGAEFRSIIERIVPAPASLTEVERLRATLQALRKLISS